MIFMYSWLGGGLRSYMPWTNSGCHTLYINYKAHLNLVGIMRYINALSLSLL